MILSKEIETYLGYMTSIRRSIHMNPELGLKELNTSQLIEDELVKMGYMPKRVFNTGIVCSHASGNYGKTIAFRADIDALPIQEHHTDKPYASKIKGIMHACGHDAHTAILLGLARYLSEHRKLIKNGNVKLIFQPAEEYPGGARELIKEGVLRDPDVDMIIGFHMWPELETGAIGLKKGILMASSDIFRITVKGQSVHGAYPHKGNDAIIAASYLICELQTIISRRVNPVIPAVITVGKIVGGTSQNIVAGEVEICGTIRVADQFYRDFLKDLIRDMCYSIEYGFDVKCKLSYEEGYPALYNDGETIDLINKAANKIFESDKVKQLSHVSMGCEDFSYYLNQVPGANVRIGCCNRHSGCPPLHSNVFDIDEKSMLHALNLFIEIIKEFLA